MKQIILILLVMFPLIALSQSKQSDEYYNKGVELYNAGKYKDAIPYFEKSNELDMQELEEGSNRREYSLHWQTAITNLAKKKWQQNCSLTNILYNQLTEG